MADTVLYAPFFQGEDANGNPLAGAKLYFYLANTTTKITIYQDSLAATPHQNPVVADSAGMFPPIFLAAGQAAYKTVLTTSAGSVIQTTDGISSVQRYSATFADLIAKWTPASASGPASLDFHEDTDNGTNRVRVIAPASLASDFTNTLPAATGTLALLTTLLDAIDGLTPAAGGFLRFDSGTTAAMAAIVGTVSQSSGVPTGAIVEKGSNANGDYVRFADGTQICWRTFVTGGATVTTADFAATFAAAPVVMGAGEGTLLTTLVALKISGRTTTKCDVVATVVSSGSSTVSVISVTADIIAVGRWY